MLVTTHSPGLRSTNSKATVAPGLSPLSSAGVGDLELHGHARPFEAGDRPVIERQRTGLGVEPVDRAFGLVPDSRRLG